jgi:hypothetical protein
MGCFCRLTMAPLAAQLEKLRHVAARPAHGEHPGAAHEQARHQKAASKVASVAEWLAARGLPEAPWRPDPAWKQLRLPTPQLSPGALSTISGLLYLRAQAQSLLGTDLLEPAQAEAFKRVIATMNERFRRTPPPEVDTHELTSLAQQNDEADQVAKALKDGVLKHAPETDELYNTPAGTPMRDWGGLLRPLRQLAPLIAATRHLDLDPDDLDPLADALRRLSRIKLPKLAEPERLEQVVRALSAQRRLRKSLGDELLKQGPEAVREKIRKKQAALAKLLGSEDETPEQVLQKLPKRAVTPTRLATEAVVQAARRMEKLAAVTWKVPENLPLVHDGLTVCHAIEQLTDALGALPVRPTPCGAQCDAAALLRAANAVAA